MTVRPDLLILGGSGPIGRGIARAAGDLAVMSASRRGPVRLDARDAPAVANLMADARPRTVVYLVNDTRATPDDAVATLGGAVRAATRAGVERFLFASSAAVYGDQGSAPYREDSALGGTSDYALVKIRSEDVLQRSAVETGVSTLSLRIFNVFGPGCVDALINRLAYGPRPRLLHTARFVRDYVHVHDVAGAFLASARRADVTGVINIGFGRGVDNLRLADAAGPEAFDPVEGADVSSFSVADIARARAALDWTPHVDAVEALRRRSDQLD